MANTNAVHTLVKGDSFITFISGSVVTDVRRFRGYDIESVVTLPTPSARKLYAESLANGYVPATAETVTVESVGHLTYEGRY